jgi:hypothetical protein
LSRKSDELYLFEALEDWQASVAQFLADRKAGVDELKTVTPQIPEE